ncbi:MAG: leucine-rich repeat domain-containing protein [Clostridia bacterium]|nr:leucine-rich repeat domain-containing protein [Clostridia bacterium]
MNNRTKQIIVVVAVFVLALASLGTVIGLIATTGRLEEYANGFYFTLSGSRATITAYDGDDTDIVIPERLRGNRVVGVGEKAFTNKASTIKSITINSTYTEFVLADEAFKDMTALEKVVLPKNLKKISASAFSGCVALRQIIIPNTVTEIGNNAFYACSNLIFAYSSEDYSTEGDDAIDEEIFYMPSGLLKIGASAFEECRSLIGAYFNKDLEELGDKAFYGATAFTELTVAKDCELATIGASAFQNTKLRSSNDYPLEFPRLVSIGDSAFSGVTTNFRQFTVPATVTSIGKEAFKGITTLTTVSFQDGSKLETMGEGVFQGCTYLTSIVLPESMKEIPSKAFMGCTRLLYNNEFKIGKNVETIGDGAFAIYSPDTISYSRYALTVDNENENFAILTLQTFSKNVNGSSSPSTGYKHGLLVSSDPDNVAVYAYYGAFDGNSFNTGAEENSLDRTSFMFYDENGSIVNSITEIKGYAFAGVAFDMIRLPKTVTLLGEYVFFNSNVRDVCIESISWEWQTNTFDLQEESSDDDDKLTVLILRSIGASAGAVSDFMEALSADGIYSGRIDWNRAPSGSN